MRLQFEARCVCSLKQGMDHIQDRTRDIVLRSAKQANTTAV